MGVFALLVAPVTFGPMPRRLKLWIWAAAALGVATVLFWPLALVAVPVLIYVIAGMTRWMWLTRSSKRK
jgi:hypothetical protein